MGRASTIPTLFNDVLKLSIQELVKECDFKNNERMEGTVSWSREDVVHSKINYSIDMSFPSITLDYFYNKKEQKYSVELTSIPSNLGRGVVWYFVCPVTFKRCRKLYCIEGRFLHREAFKGVYYESQTLSPKNRQLCRMYDNYFLYEELLFQLHKKYFKRTYKGQPTKRYLKLVNKLKELEPYQSLDIERLMLM